MKSPLAALVCWVVFAAAPGSVGAQETSSMAIPEHESAEAVAFTVPKAGEAVNPRSEAEPALMTWNKIWQGAVSNARIVAENILRVRLVEVRGANRFSAGQWETMLGFQGARWLWEAVQPGFGARLKRSPWCERAVLHWEIYPLRLTVDVTEAEPWLVAEFGQHSWLLSRRGQLLQPLESVTDQKLIVEISELPRLSAGGDEGSPGAGGGLDAAGEKFHTALNRLKLIDEAGGFPFDVERFTMLNDGALQAEPLRSGEFPKVTFLANGKEGAFDTLRRLATVLDDLKKRGESASEVDLRFAKQAVVR